MSLKIFRCSICNREERFQEFIPIRPNCCNTPMRRVGMHSAFSMISLPIDNELEIVLNPSSISNMQESKFPVSDKEEIRTVINFKDGSHAIVSMRIKQVLQEIRRCV